jgi:hypothetical protein
MGAPPVVRRVLLTGAVVGITVTGTLYGAGLKMDQEVKRVSTQLKLSLHFKDSFKFLILYIQKDARKRELETVDEKIEALEARKKKLVASKVGLEKQITDLEAKQKLRREQQMLDIQDQQQQQQLRKDE